MTRERLDYCRKQAQLVLTYLSKDKAHLPMANRVRAAVDAHRRLGDGLGRLLAAVDRYTSDTVAPRDMTVGEACDG